jgi:SAM-dependent methyltransferase
MIEEFWDQRYAHSDYAYGTKPNAFFKKELDKLAPGKVLLPGEGEGRNAVYAAVKGWEVVAFDFSTEARKKAQRLADRLGVEIEYRTGTYESLELEEKTFDLVAFIYVHLDPRIRRAFHGTMVNTLKPDGKLILEGFSTDQFTRTTGGPKRQDMLFSENILRKDFEGLSRLKIWEKEVLLNEGDYHQGLAAVIRAKGTK